MLFLLLLLFTQYLNHSVYNTHHHAKTSVSTLLKFPSFYHIMHITHYATNSVNNSITLYIYLWK